MFLNDLDDSNTYPSGFSPAKIYDNHKMHKTLDISPSFSIIPYVETYNYKLAKHPIWDKVFKSG